MKATDVIGILAELIRDNGDLEVECRNCAGDRDYIEAAFVASYQHHGKRIVLTTDSDEMSDAG